MKYKLTIANNCVRAYTFDLCDADYDDFVTTHPLIMYKEN